MRVVPKKSHRSADKRSAKYRQLRRMRNVLNVQIVGESRVACQIGQHRQRAGRNNCAANREAVESILAQLERIGRKMTQMRQAMAEGEAEEAESAEGGGRDVWHARHELKRALREARGASPEEARRLFAAFPGLRVIDDTPNGKYPLPSICSGSDDTFIGRIRRDLSHPNGLNFWCVSDNLRKGAATNAVQIAELLAKHRSEKAAV